MQSLRNNLRQFPTHIRKNGITKPTSAIHTMSLFPRFTQEFAPLFRLMDDYDRRTFRPGLERLERSFTPKFDVKEHENTYELHGEFPGVEQKDINIEWTDSNTLTVSGRHEIVREEGERPANLEAGDGSTKKIQSKQPSVEDEADAEPKVAEQQVAQRSSQEVAKENENKPKYWVSERSVGEFHRSFSFPQRVDQDAVKASLKNGILSIVVPKGKAPQPRKVTIE